MCIRDRNRAALDYFVNNEDSLDLFLQFLNKPEMILSHGEELRKILDLSNQQDSEGTPNESNLTVTDSLSEE